MQKVMAAQSPQDSGRDLRPSLRLVECSLLISNDVDEVDGAFRSDLVVPRCFRGQETPRGSASLATPCASSVFVAAVPSSARASATSGRYPIFLAIATMDSGSALDRFCRSGTRVELRLQRGHTVPQVLDLPFRCGVLGRLHDRPQHRHIRATGPATRAR